MVDVFTKHEGLLADEAFGDVVPRPPPGEPTVYIPADDVRDACMARFREFLSKLRFTRIGPSGELAGYNIPIERIFEEQPPDVTRLDMPCISFLPQVESYEALSLGPGNALEETADKYGKGTVVVETANYSEKLTVEVWGSSEAMRRSVRAGIKTALQNSAVSGAMRLTLPKFFDQVASFALVEAENANDAPEIIKNRRRAMVFVQVNAVDCHLVRYVPFQPTLVSHIRAANEALNQLPRSDGLKRS